MKLLVTGGAGFIGSAFVRYSMSRPDAPYQIVNLDKLTYAGNLDNLAEVEGNAGYTFVQGDICDATRVARLLAEHKPDAIVRFDCQRIFCHVDRVAFSRPKLFFRPNLRGTFTLLEAAQDHAQ